MSIRDTLNENRTIVMAVAILVAVAAGVIAIRQVMQIVNPVVDTGIQARLFYSDDDGVSFFADSADKVPPFDHNGKEAVLAHVYTCEGKQVVLFLERFTPERKKIQEEANAQRSSGAVILTSVTDPRETEEIKKPGASEWVNKNHSDANTITAPKCPDGPGGPGQWSVEVFPE